MASEAYIRSLLNSLDASQARVLYLAFAEVCEHFRIGTATKALNADWFRVSFTTSGTASAEFSVPHGLGSAPSTLFPVMDLNTVGSQLVPLVNSRAPDSNRIYLKSTSTSATMTVLLEP